MAQAKRGDGPFVIENSDGCSALSIPYRFITKHILRKERRLSFLVFCIEHDEAYWYGGTKEQRLTADVKLFCGVRNQAKTMFGDLFYLSLASAMFTVARVMGSPHIPSPFRWMYKDSILESVGYTDAPVLRDETVTTNKDSEIVKTLMDNPWTLPLSVPEAVEVLKEGKESTVLRNESQLSKQPLDLSKVL